jgi:hypothetical protein
MFYFHSSNVHLLGGSCGGFALYPVVSVGVMRGA